MNKQTEYASLRAEIISLESIQSNYIAGMYTITIAIVTLAIQQQNEWIFLLPYIILFSFQRIITAKKNAMLRIAAYIAVFLDGEFGWEKNYNEIVNNTLNKHNNKEKFSKFKNIISGRISSLQLGLVCSLGCIILSISHILEDKGWKSLDSIEWKNIGFLDMLPVIFAVLLFCGLLDWCKDSLKAIDMRNKYIESLKNYKDEINSKYEEKS